MMKYIFLLFAFLTFQFVFGQELAVTESGDTIFVFSDGTWSYDRQAKDFEVTTPNTLDFTSEEIQIDSTLRTLSLRKNANKKIEKEVDFFTIAYNTEVWERVPPATINPAATYTFSDENEGRYAMVIAEEFEIGAENTYKFALQNAEKNIGSRPEIISSEWVNVNGVDMINGQYKIDINGLKFVFNSLFYSSAKGTIQFMTWSFENKYAEQKVNLDAILSGLTIK